MARIVGTEKDDIALNGWDAFWQGVGVALLGTGNDDEMFGLGGDDFIVAADGDDYLNGGEGATTCRAAKGTTPISSITKTTGSWKRAATVPIRS